MHSIFTVFVMCTAAALVGCERSPDKSVGAKPPAAAGGAKTEPEHKSGDKHDDGELVELGTTKIGELTVRAARGEGDVRPGDEAAIDVWLTTADGKPANVSIVRFWIGAADAKGLVKAKAEIEDSAQPNHWHAHVETPKPLPEGAKVWIEIESTAGKSTGSFELKK